jgi:pimeloyl-ACP methyl ester carboxylesterase
MSVKWKAEEHSVFGVKTEVLTAGKGDPVMFWHGAGTGSGWDFLEPLTAKFKVYLPYHPGWGGSGDDPGMTSVQDYVMHYLELLDILKIGKFSLVGLSMGGWFASTFATQHGERLKKLVLVAPAGLLVREHPTTDLFKVKPEELVPMLAENPAALGPPPDPHDIDFIVKAYREQTSFARLAWQRIYDTKLPKYLHRISAPTLFVWGKQDKIVPEAQSATWMKLVKGSKLKTFSPAGHLVLDEKPEAVKAIRDFLAA